MNPTKIFLLVATALAAGCYSEPVVYEQSGAARPTTTVVTREVTHKSVTTPPVVVTGETVVAPPRVTTPAPVLTITRPPPTAPIEEMGVQPRPDSAWVPGYWKRSGARWDWVAGHWQSLPRGYNTYIPGHWEQKTGAWVYYEGFWQ